MASNLRANTRNLISAKCRTLPLRQSLRHLVQVQSKTCLRVIVGLFALLGALPNASAQSSAKNYPFQILPYSSQTEAHYSEFLSNYQRSLSSLAEFNLQNYALIHGSSSDLNERFNVARCQRYYSDLIARRELRIRTVYGYYDSFTNHGGKSSVTVGDRAELELLSNQLTRPCPRDSQGACGFSIQDQDGQLTRLFKTILGPDRKSISVSLELIHSSASDSDRENRMSNQLNRASEDQVRASEFAKDKFLRGFREADVLVYLGHARAGGGPDFYPPRLSLRSQRDPVDYSFYNRERKSFREMISALKQSSQPPKVLALFACKSAPMFAGSRDALSREMRNLVNQQGSLFIGSSNLTDSNSDLGNYIGLVDALLNMRCGPGFGQGIRIERAGNTTEFIGQTP